MIGGQRTGYKIDEGILVFSESVRSQKKFFFNFFFL